MDKNRIETILYEVWIDYQGSWHCSEHSVSRDNFECNDWAFVNFKTTCGATVFSDRLTDVLHFENRISTQYQNKGWRLNALARCITENNDIEEIKKNITGALQD